MAPVPARLDTASTPHLEMAYETRGPASSETLVLLHGFPDDVRTWDAVAAAPELGGLRIVVPYLRGYGPTRFRDPATPRTGEAAALARDVVDLLDALGVERCAVAGHDWGARAAYGAAVLAPERVRSVVALSVGYGTNIAGQRMSLAQAEHYWYQWFFATARGEAALRDDRRAFCRYLWARWSPGLHVDDETFERTAAAFDNPDFVAVVLHSYRQRWGFAAGDPSYAADAAALASLPRIAPPVRALIGSDDGATLPEALFGNEALFASYDATVLPGAGHFLTRERPQAVIDTIVAALA